MKQLIYLFFLLAVQLSFSTNIFAQEKIIVMRTSGTSLYQEDATTDALQLFSGTELPKWGTIQLSSGASIRLLINGKVKELNGEGSYNVAAILQKESSGRPSNFLSRFWKFVSEGVSNTGDEGKLEKYHERYMEEHVGGISGFGKGVFGILTPFVYGPILAEANVSFCWSSLDSTTIYRFKLLRSEDKQIIAQMVTRDTVLSLAISSLAMDGGMEYYWEVERDGKVGSKQSGKYTRNYFVYEPERKHEINATVTTEADFQLADQTDQQLMLAQIYEYNELTYTAYQLYQMLREEQPKNKLVDRLYQAFLARQNALFLY